MGHVMLTSWPIRTVPTPFSMRLTCQSKWRPVSIQSSRQDRRWHFHEAVIRQTALRRSLRLAYQAAKTV